MNNSKFALLIVVTPIIFSCGSVNKTISLAYNNPKQVYTGDTVYLIQPKAIVRRHFGEGVNDFEIDSAENKKAATELVYGIKKLGKKKITILDLQADEGQWREFYCGMNPLLANNNDSVYLNLKLSDSLNLSSLIRKKKIPVIISYLEWDYDTKDLYQKLYTEYSWQSGRGSSGRLVFTKSISTMKLHFIVVDPSHGQIISWHFKKYSDTKIKIPAYSNMGHVLPNVMQPFLKTVK